MMKHLTSGTVKNRKSALRDDAPRPPAPFLCSVSHRGVGAGPASGMGAAGPPAKNLRKFPKTSRSFKNVCRNLLEILEMLKTLKHGNYSRGGRARTRTPFWSALGALAVWKHRAVARRRAGANSSPAKAHETFHNFREV